MGRKGLVIEHMAYLVFPSHCDFSILVADPKAPEIIIQDIGSFHLGNVIYPLDERPGVRVRAKDYLHQENKLKYAYSLAIKNYEYII